MKICKYCGAKLADSDAKCISCGAEEFYRIAEEDDTAHSGKAHHATFFRLLGRAPKKIRMWMAVALAGLILLLGLNVYQVLFPGRGLARLAQPVNIGFRDIGELATQAAYYTEIISEEDYRSFFNTSLNVPGTKRHIIVSFNGIIKAGIDFTQIEYKIDDENKLITVHLPEPKVMSNEVDHNSMTVWYEQLNIFNPSTLVQNNELYLLIEQNGEQHARENGLMENAAENAKVLVLNTCKTVLPDYEIQFE